MFLDKVRLVKSDSERGEFGAWLRHERRARFKNVSAAVAEMKRTKGYGITVSEWAEFEAGTRRPSPDRRIALQAFLGAVAPAEVSEGPTGDLSALVSAISSQTEALNRVADRLEAQSTGDLREAIALAVSQTVQALIQQGLLAVPPARPPRREKQATNG